MPFLLKEGEGLGRYIYRNLSFRHTQRLTPSSLPLPRTSWLCITLLFLTQTPTCNSDTTGYGSTVANVAHAHFKKVVSVFFLQQVYLEVFGCEVAAAHAGHSSAFRCKGFYLGVHSSFSLSMCCLFFGVMLSFKRLP